MSMYDLRTIKKTIKEYTGEDEDKSYTPFHKLQFELTRKEFMSLFPFEIAILHDIEVLISEASDENYHFHVFFPKSSTRDFRNDNKLWFVIKRNKITGVVFNGCSYIKKEVWVKVFKKLWKLKHLEKALFHDVEKRDFQTVLF